MSPRIISVRPLERYTVQLAFTDGTQAAVDLGRWIIGHSGVFEPLHDESFFRQVQVDPEAGTIVWPNGVDFCPDVLYAEAVGATIGS